MFISPILFIFFGVYIVGYILFSELDKIMEEMKKDSKNDEVS